MALGACGNLFSYAKKIEVLQHPATKNEVHIYYDLHDDMSFPDQVKDQVQEITDIAKQKNAHIILENTFGYLGSNENIKDDLEFFKYDSKALLLRDIQDAAEQKNVSVENVEYRQDKEYSVKVDNLAAGKALDTVSLIITQIKKFKGEDLKDYYESVVDEIEPAHVLIKDIFDENMSIHSQITKNNIAKMITDLRKDLPQDCQYNDPEQIVLHYDARLLNPLVVNSIYEKQIANQKHKCIFVIAGSYHSYEVSRVLQDCLGYEVVKDEGTLENAFQFAQSKLELSQVQNFYNNSHGMPALEKINAMPLHVARNANDLKESGLYIIV